MTKTAPLALMALTGLLTLTACGGGAPGPSKPLSEPREDPAAATGPEASERAATPVATGSAAPPLPSTLPGAPRQFGWLTERLAATPLSEVVTPQRVVAPTEDYAKWRARRQIRVGVSHLSFAERFPDDRHAAVMGFDQKVRIYDLLNGKLLSSVQLADATNPLALWPEAGAPHGAWLAVERNQSALLLDATTGEAAGGLSMKSNLGSLRWTRDGKVAGLTAARIPQQTGGLLFMDQTGRALLHLESQERIEDWVLSEDGKRLCIAYFPSNTLEVVDLEAGRVLLTHGTPEYTNSVDLSPDGRLLVVAGAEVWLIPLDAPTNMQTYKGLKNNAHRARFSPSGDAVVVASYDGHARVLKPGSGSELVLVKALRHAGTANVYAAEFSRDGTTLLTSSGDQTLILWGR